MDRGACWAIVHRVAKSWIDWATNIFTSIPFWGLLRWLSGKESACQPRRHRRHCFNPQDRRSPWGGNSNPLQHSCLENPMDIGAWCAAVHGVAKSWTQLKTSTHTIFTPSPALFCISFLASVYIYIYTCDVWHMCMVKCVLINVL